MFSCCVCVKSVHKWKSHPRKSEDSHATQVFAVETLFGAEKSRLLLINQTITRTQKALNCETALCVVDGGEKTNAKIKLRHKHSSLKQWWDVEAGLRRAKKHEKALLCT